MAFDSEQTRPLLLRGPSPGVRLLLLCVFSVLLMVLDHQQNHLRSLRAALSVAIHPLRVMVDLPFAATSWVSENLATRSHLTQENTQLRQQIQELQFRLQRLQALQVENTRLREMMGSTAPVAERILVAEILSVDLDPYRHRLVLNKGTQDGAHDGQAILDARGVVGQITIAEPLSSQAIMITDPSHATPVQINRNGIRTVALGSGDTAELALPFLPNSTDIEVGDLLVTSGLGGHFPPGYPVGTVSSVVRDPAQSFAWVRAQPTAMLDRGGQVLLVWFGPPQTRLEQDQADARDAGEDRQ
jgi:rod shape-determining protein MreC